MTSSGKAFIIYPVTKHGKHVGTQERLRLDETEAKTVKAEWWSCVAVQSTNPVAAQDS